MFKWIKGHSNLTRNDEADKLAAEGVSAVSTRNTIFINQPDFFNNSAQLNKLTQATAYSLIRRSHPNLPPPNKNTITNLDLIREATHNLDSTRPSNNRIWTAAIKNRRDLSTSVRTFLWKLIHNAHKCGPYWLKIKNLEDRGICHSCNSVESMLHVIFNCEANNCTYAWNVVKEICTLKNIQWPQGFDISTVMALPILKVRSANGKARSGASHLLLIAASECAFFLWKTRCKRLLVR